mmetsp:Transcript_70873/g.196900  ORF Transcript_70873/g.196900 Transcript_70873/m.196900 type:complete len:233 (-) Transcript_70873:184-882(-)|eukprot:CAMPEP_0117559374 /NCGR_PEP_ID=MMETSP0784-20121206/53331_1 /TAXON_ID=39447 /ORGANISM="" /LENGTH=232 /DNA_ID=CAMNT_0005356757 /DNA_START=49 /DNA_END=747 /DNA_ORIENTATION=+
MVATEATSDAPTSHAADLGLPADLGADSSLPPLVEGLPEGWEAMLEGAVSGVLENGATTPGAEAADAAMAALVAQTADAPTTEMPAAPVVQRETYPDICAVYVGNVHNETIPEELYEHFSPCGEIKRITIKVNRDTGERMGFCYIDFGEAQNVEDAMVLDGSTFKGQEIKVVKKRDKMQEWNQSKSKGKSGRNKGGFGYGYAGDWGGGWGGYGKGGGWWGVKSGWGKGWGPY